MPRWMRLATPPGGPSSSACCSGPLPVGELARDFPDQPAGHLAAPADPQTRQPGRRPRRRQSARLRGRSRRWRRCAPTSNGSGTTPLAAFKRAAGQRRKGNDVDDERQLTRRAIPSARPSTWSTSAERAFQRLHRRIRHAVAAQPQHRQNGAAEGGHRDQARRPLLPAVGGRQRMRLGPDPRVGSRRSGSCSPGS